MAIRTARVAPYIRRGDTDLSLASTHMTVRPTRPPTVDAAVPGTSSPVWVLGFNLAYSGGYRTFVLRHGT